MKKNKPKEVLEKGKEIKEKMEKGYSLKDVKIQEMLSKELPVFQSIGMGLQNGVLYFGIKINDDEGRFFDAVVTSDKKIYIDWKNHNEVKSEFGLNYRFPFYHDILDYSWSRLGKYGINAWLYKKMRKISLKKVFEKVLELQKWKVWHPDERTHKHHALKIVSTYFLPIFEMKGRELIYGDSGFGKTRQTKIYQLLAFNSSMSMDWSDAGVFRSIESTKATVLIDNFDTVGKEKKGRILHIFNTGCYTRQKAIRSVGKTFRPTGFNVYSGMVLNTILPINEVSENRSSITRCLRTDNKKYWKLDEKNPVWQEIRDMLHTCALQNHKTVQKIYEKLKAEESLLSREFERVSDILTIAKIISDDLYKQMLEYYIEDNKRRKVKDYKDNWLYVAIELIVERLEKKKEVELSVKDIAESKANEIFDMNAKDFTKKVHWFKTYLGKAFRSNPLFKSRLIHGYSYYTFRKVDLLKFCRIKNFDELVEKLKKNIKDFVD